MLNGFENDDNDEFWVFGILIYFFLGFDNVEGCVYVFQSRLLKVRHFQIHLLLFLSDGRVACCPLRFCSPGHILISILFTLIIVAVVGFIRHYVLSRLVIVFNSRALFGSLDFFSGNP